MRSIFWRIFLVFWLAIVAIGGLTFALGRFMVEGQWLMSFYPHLSSYAPIWTKLYEEEGLPAARRFSMEQARQYGIRASVLSADGEVISMLMAHGPGHDRRGAMPGRGAGARFAQNARDIRQITYEYTSPGGNGYIFRFALSVDAMRNWQSRFLFLPLGLLSALLTVTLASWLLSLYLTRPINRLRDAVGKLEQTHYQSAQLQHISTRRDELGMLARDFNRMGEKLQAQLESQRQLLRDVSHELRSPLARLRIALGLAERQSGRQNGAVSTGIWSTLDRECDRLDGLIGEILALSRFDSASEVAETFDLTALLKETLAEYPDLPVNPAIPDTPLWIKGWPGWLEKAISNLLRNAARFNPPAIPLDVSLASDNKVHVLRIRDHGPGCAPALLPRLGEPFVRAPDQRDAGYGLGLAIARRVVARHSGTIRFALPENDLPKEQHPEGASSSGGFEIVITLPAADAPHDLHARNAPHHAD